MVTIIITSCVTNRPVLLDSPQNMQTSAVVNPSLSIPTKGIHPYVGLSVGIKGKDLENESSFSFVKVGLNGGVLYQTSLENEKTIAFFSSLNISMDYTSFTFYQRREQKALLSQELKDKLNEKPYSLSSEFALRSGFSLRVLPCVVSIYGIGLSIIEKGSYYDWRKEIDNIANYYNMNNIDHVFGYGFGGDIAFGKMNKTNVGFVFERHIYIVDPQSPKIISEMDNEDLESDVGIYNIKRQGIDRILLLKSNGGIYVDEQNMRVQLLMIGGGASMNVFYRW
jgi:hypothetical protein